ncbi:MAG: 5'-nucleotidase C-terminal domain-containing protein [Deltaproteobacteria bacterium]|nr:5'-nucleotidase C-terminal domain-containing protein [Deltaproteobacteria bacterium]
MSATTLTIFHFTDPHARLGAEPVRAPGIPGVANPSRPDAEVLAGLAGLDALLAEELTRVEAGPVLLVCCGDVFGAEMAHDRAHRGALTVEALSLLAGRSGVDAALWLAGNHDVDHGVDRFSELAPGSGMHLMSGNATVDGRPLSDGLVELDVGGVRLAVVPVTTVQIASDAPREDRERVGARLPVLAAREPMNLARRARKKGSVDIVLALAHCFDEEDEALARLGPDLLIGGHTHVFLSSRIPGGSRREKAGCHGQALGRVVVRRTFSGWRVDEHATALLLPDVEPAPDSKLLALARRGVPGPSTEPAVGACSEPIRGLGDLRAARPSPIGSAVAAGLLDGARRVAGPVHCAFINAGNVRAELVPVDGLLRRSDLADVLAFGNQLAVVEGPPELVLEVLAVAVANLKLDKAGWLRTAGLRARVSAEGAIEDVRVEEEGRSVPLASLQTVRMATIDWLAVDGGNHFGCLGRGAVSPLGVASDCWAEELASRPTPTIRVPLEGLVVDARFRQTDTRTVVETLQRQAPGSVTWATDLLDQRGSR